MSEEEILRIRPTGLHTTRQHRTLYEQVLVRFPVLVRALSMLRLRLPMRSRLRRFLLLQFAAGASAAANRQDFDLLFSGFDPQLDLRTAAGVYPTELSGHHYGHSGYRNLWGKLLEVWEDVRIEPEEVIDTGDCIISRTRVDTRGAGSGVPVSVTMFQVFTFRGGLVVRQDDVEDREEALEAAGCRSRRCRRRTWRLCDVPSRRIGPARLRRQWRWPQSSHILIWSSCRI